MPAFRSLSILLATVDVGGNLPPLLAVAQALVLRGHAVRVLAEPSSQKDVVATGATFISWTKAPHRPDRSREEDLIKDWMVADPRLGAMRIIERLACGPSQLYAEDAIEELNRRPADLVLALDMLLGIIAACEARGQKVVALAPHLSLFPIEGLPPFGGGLPPAKTPEQRAMHAEIARSVEMLFDSGLPALNSTRVWLGLPHLAHLSDQITRADAHWLLTSRAFDFPAPALPDGTRYVGSAATDPGWAEQWISPWPPTDQRPLVLVAFSTGFQNHVDVLNRIVRALGDVEARVLVTLGPAVSVDEIEGSPNAHIVASASHEAVMREADLVVTHGGHGTVIRALRHGVPMLILPHGRDQADNGVRVTERQAGIMLPASASEAEIRQAAAQILDDESFGANARALSVKINKEAEGTNIVDIIEQMFGSLV